MHCKKCIQEMVLCVESKLLGEVPSPLGSADGSYRSKKEKEERVRQSRKKEERILWGYETIDRENDRLVT